MKKKLYLLLALLLAAAVIVVGVLFFANTEPQEQAADAPETPVIALAEDLSVYWDRVENAESYIVYRRVYNASTKKWSSWQNIGSQKTTRYKDKTAKSGVTYKYTVRAVNGDYKSSYKASSSVKR